MEFLKTSLDQLKKGDIFTYDKNSPFEQHRFHSYRFHSFEKKWHDEFEPGSRLCVHYSRFYGTVDKSFGGYFQWQQIGNPAEITVYIIQNYQISDSGKHKGQIYYQGQGTRDYDLKYEVNPINFDFGVQPFAPEETLDKKRQFYGRLVQLFKLGFKFYNSYDFYLPDVWSVYWEQIYSPNTDEWGDYIKAILKAIERKAA